jgi:hypothetical protein
VAILLDLMAGGRKWWLGSALGLGAILIWGPAEALEKWGPFRGQIVDAETGQPIAGAVVLVVWWEAVPTPVQTNRKFYDARETVTDAEGRFEVPRRPPPFFGFRIFPPRVTYIAPGYAAQDEVVTPPDGQPLVASTVVKMRRLTTKEERVKNQRRYPPSIPAAKMPRLLQALNRERAALGLEPITRGTADDP